jgi:type I toxin-antitoxin system toxin SymE
MPKQLKLYGSEESSNNNCPVTKRRLKVYYGSHQGGTYSRHPVVRIGGNYLRAYGFKTGDTIEIKLSQGRIEITKVQPE